MAVGSMAYSLPYMCCSVIFFSIFVYTATVMATFSPLFTALECVPLGSNISTTMNGTWVYVTGTSGRECRNPNPYSFSISGWKTGRVFIKNGTELKLVGESRVIDSEYPADGTGIATSTMDIALDLIELGALIAQPVLQVVVETHVSVQPDLRFFGFAVAASDDSDAVCGFEVRFVGMQVGPSACAGTVEEIEFPDVDAEPTVSVVSSDEDKLAAQELKKNVLLGSILAFTFLGAVASAALGTWRARRLGRQDKDAQARGKVLQVIVEDEEVN